MKRILVTGANGFLGQHLCRHLQQNSYHVIATGRGNSRLPAHEAIEYITADLTNADEVAALVATCSPDVIIHNAALSKPDECEADHAFCLLTNVETTRHLLAGFGGHFIYMSTDFIFGEGGPHPEDAPPDPLNFYGESKLLAEKLVVDSGVAYTIVRLVFIYGEVWPGMRGSFLHWVKTNLEQQKTVRILSDQSRTPTYTKDICKGIAAIIDQGVQGAYHLAGKDILSPYHMALKTAEVLNLDSSYIQEATAETFPEPVRRAKRSGLTIQKAQQDLGYAPVSFEDGIRLTFGL